MYWRERVDLLRGNIHEVIPIFHGRQTHFYVFSSLSYHRRPILALVETVRTVAPPTAGESENLSDRVGINHNKKMMAPIVKNLMLRPSVDLINRPVQEGDHLVRFPIIDDDDKCDNYII